VLSLGAVGRDDLGVVRRCDRFRAAALVVSLFVLCSCSGGRMDDAVPAECPVNAAAPNPITRAADPLVEPEGVRSAMVCRYDGGAHLEQSGVVTDPSPLDSLISEINAGEPLPAGPISCPVMDGSTYTIYLARGERSREAVVVQASGCRSVQRGRDGHWATNALITRLSSIAGANEAP
jgi:hypothetical protein